MECVGKLRDAIIELPEEYKQEVGIAFFRYMEAMGRQIEAVHKHHQEEQRLDAHSSFFSDVLDSNEDLENTKLPPKHLRTIIPN